MARQLKSIAKKSAKPKTALKQLLSTIQEHIDALSYDTAYKFCQEAIKLDANNLQILELYGMISLELGHVEEAHRCYCKILEISPDHVNALLSLAQLTSEKESLIKYQKAIEVMEKSFGNTKDASIDLLATLSTAYCSLAELYMTDLCFESDAEILCEKYANRALEIDKNNSEAYQTMANLLLVKQCVDEAKEYLVKSCKLWLPANVISQRNNATNSMETEEEHDELLSPLPSYSSRMTLSKSLIEVELYELSLVVLETLQKENDEIIEMWYLYGTVFWMLGCREALCIANTSIISGKDRQEKIENYIKLVVGKNIVLNDNVEKLWQQGFECLEEAKSLIVDKHIECEPELLEQVKEMYETFSSIFNN